MEFSATQHLLPRKDYLVFCAPRDAVMPSLRGIEQRLTLSPERAEVYKSEIKKLELGLGLPSSHLLGVLLQFTVHCVAISGDIGGMFNQVLLLPEDRPLLHILWCDMQTEEPPDTYEWQVLLFGMTCNPCCASFALQQNVALHSTPNEDVRFSVNKCFYIDNCLQSLPSAQEAQQLVDKICALLYSGGFNIRQRRSNDVTYLLKLGPAGVMDFSRQSWTTWVNPSPELAL